MIEKDFRELHRDELKAGVAIWLQGKSFLDTSGIGPPANTGRHPVCGPFLIERILFQTQPEPRVDLVDPATGDRRSMLCSWLLTPKENNDER